MKQIETERLVLRRFKLSDAIHMSKLFFDEKSMYRLSLGKPFESFAQVEHIMDNWGKDEGRFAIAMKSSNVPVGYAAVQRCGDRGELSLASIPGYRGMGFAKEAAEALVTNMPSFGVKALDAHILKGNNAIQSLLEDVGFIYKGEEVAPFSSSQHRILWYSIDAEE